MAKATLEIGDKEIDVEFSFDSEGGIEKLERVTYGRSGRAVDLARNDMHHKVFVALEDFVISRDFEYEDGENPANIFINREGLAEFDPEKDFLDVDALSPKRPKKAKK
jgi:hypothetical protein